MENDREMFKATCSDCGAQCEVPFEPTPGKPVRCRECFSKNRPQRSGSGFGGNRGGGRFGGGNRRFGDRDNRPREMFKATCSDCGKACEVPFKPTAGKPVRCRECFQASRD